MAEDVVAVFRADIQDFKKKVEECTDATHKFGEATEQVKMSWTDFMKGRMGPLMQQLGSHSAAIKQLAADYKVYKETGQAAAVQTQQFTGHTKSAAQSIRTLSQGLGGVTGLLAITGRLLGINTDKLQDLVHTSQLFIHTAREIQHTQHLVNIATKEGTVAKVADEGATVSLTVAEKALQLVKSAGIGIYVAVGAAIVAAGVAIWNYVQGKKEELQNIKDSIAFNRIQEKHYEDLKILLNDLEKIRATNAVREKIRQGTATEDDLKILKGEQDKNDKLVEISKQFAGEKTKIQLELDRRLEKETKLIRKGTLENDEWVETQDLGAIERNKKRKEDANKRLLELDKSFMEQARTLFTIQSENTTEIKKESTKKEADDLKKIRDAESEKEWQAFLSFWAKKDKANQDALDALLKEEQEFAKNKQKLIEEEFEAEQNAFLKNQKIAFDASLKNLELLRALKEENALTPEQAEALKKLEKDINDKRIEQAKQVTDAIFKAQEEAYNKKKDLLDKELTDQEGRIEAQRRLAENGFANTLAFEEKKAAELKQKQLKEAQDQKRIKQLESFVNHLAEFSKSEKTVGGALQKALLAMALETAATALFAEEGGVIGEIRQRSFKGRRHRGGGDVLVHAQTGEGILSRREMDNLGKRNFHLLKDAARFPIREDVFGMPKIAIAGGSQMSNEEVVKEIRTLQHIIRNKKEMDINWDSHGNLIETVRQDGITSITKKKKRWRS